jgi:hypothetical protein
VEPAGSATGRAYRRSLPKHLIPELLQAQASRYRCFFPSVGAFKANLRVVQKIAVLEAQPFAGKRTMEKPGR